MIMMTEEKQILIQLTELNQKISYISGLMNDFKETIKDSERRIENNNRHIYSIDRKFESWVNKIKGASFAIVIIFGIFQGCVVGFLTWGFNHISRTEDRLLILEHQMIHLMKK